MFFFFVLFPLSVNLYFLALHEFYEHLVLQAPDIAKVLQIYYSSSACGRSMNEWEKIVKPNEKRRMFRE